MKKTKAEELLEKYKKSKDINKDDKEIIYDNYITYINNKDNFDEYQKNLILNYLRNMLMHSNKILLMDELDNSIHSILQSSKEKEILSTNLKRYMEYRKSSVTDLANKINLPYSTVNDWVNGVSYPRVDKLNILAEALGVSKRDLTEPQKNNKIHQNNSSVIVPVLGRIPAGIPLEAIEEILDYEEIPAKWLTSDKQFFALRIKRQQYVSFL